MEAALAAARRAAWLRRPRLLPWAPLLTLTLLIGPVAAGLAGALAPAFGWLPALGGERLSLAPWRDLLAWPGLGHAVTLSLLTGAGATAASLGLTLLLFAAWSGTRPFRAVERALAPLLAAPHAATALGLAFLIAPSGWLARLASPWATGWERPPDWLTVNDLWGLSLAAGLAVKEAPFLALMTLAALSQADAARGLRAARALGYGRAAGWCAAVLPRVYPQIRLPVYAALAYAMANVDMALILGPTTPPTLAVQVLRWSRDPDLALQFQAAAAATLQLGLVLGALALWRLTEKVVAALGRRWVEGGRRLAGADGPARALGAAGGLALAGAAAGAALGLAVWSLAGFWGFPDALPETITLRNWSRYGEGLAAALGETALIAAAATLIGLTLAVACLEAEHRHGLRPTARSLWLLYLPLVTPEVSFLLGLQTLAAASGLDGGRLTVIAAHAVFTTPYVFLALADPWRAWDRRFGLAAATLGAGSDRTLWAVRLPMLLRPVATASAVGFAVSAGLYLPTLLIGGGRVETLATEAVALASGGDRRAIGVFALTQTAAALAGFALALAIPALAFRNRRALRA